MTEMLECMDLGLVSRSQRSYAMLSLGLFLYLVAIIRLVVYPISKENALRVFSYFCSLRRELTIDMTSGEFLVEHIVYGVSLESFTFQLPLRRADALTSRCLHAALFVGAT